MKKQDVSHTDTIYQITKLTREALEEVEKGCDPYSQYDKIKEVIDRDSGYEKSENTKNLMCAYLTFAAILFLGVVSVVSAIASLIFLLDTNWFAMLGCMLLFCLALPGAVCLFIVMDNY